jgi:hypothetical protein
MLIKHYITWVFDSNALLRRSATLMLLYSKKKIMQLRFWLLFCILCNTNIINKSEKVKKMFKTFSLLF